MNIISIALAIGLVILVIFTNFVTWYVTLGGLGAILLTIFIAIKIRGKIRGVDENWNTGVIPVAAIMALHLGIYWMCPEFWLLEYQKAGFILLEILLILGFYSASLKEKAPKLLGMSLILLGLIGLSVNTYDVLQKMKIISVAEMPAPNDPSTGHLGERIYPAPVAPAWSEKIYTLDQFWYNPSSHVKMRVNGNDNWIVDIRPDSGGDVGRGVKFIEFQSTDKATEKVAVFK